MPFGPTNRRHPVQLSFESGKADPTRRLHPQRHLLVSLTTFAIKTYKIDSCHYCHPLKKKTLIPIQISFQRAWSSTTAGRQSAFMTYHRHAQKKCTQPEILKGSACRDWKSRKQFPRIFHVFKIFFTAARAWRKRVAAHRVVVGPYQTTASPVGDFHYMVSDHVQLADCPKQAPEKSANQAWTSWLGRQKSANFHSSVSMYPPTRVGVAWYILRKVQT